MFKYQQLGQTVPLLSVPPISQLHAAAVAAAS